MTSMLSAWAEPTDSDLTCFEGSIEEPSGIVRLSYPPLFHADRRGFCRGMVEATLRQPGVRAAGVDLAKASFQVEFTPEKRAAREMADAITAAVRAALDAESRVEGGWFQRQQSERAWAALSAYASDDGASIWELLRVEPDRILLHHQALHDGRDRLAALADAIARSKGVDFCRVSLWSAQLEVRFDPSQVSVDQLLEGLERERARLARKGVAEVPSTRLTHVDLSGEIEGPPPVATGVRRIWYLAQAGGSLILTAVAYVLPVVPTWPFMMATSYYLSRSSPRLHDLLLRSWFFGPLIHDWEKYRGLSLPSKGRLVGLMVLMTIVTLILVPVTPLLLLLMALSSLLTLYGIARMPGVKAGIAAPLPVPAV